VDNVAQIWSEITAKVAQISCAVNTAAQMTGPCPHIRQAT